MSFKASESREPSQISTKSSVVWNPSPRLGSLISKKSASPQMFAFSVLFYLTIILAQFFRSGHFIKRDRVIHKKPGPAAGLPARVQYTPPATASKYGQEQWNLKSVGGDPPADSFLTGKRLLVPGAACWLSTSTAVISPCEFWNGLRERKRKRSKSYERHIAFKGTVMRFAEKLLIRALSFYFQYTL